MSMNNLILCAANKIKVTKPNGETVDLVVADSEHFQKNMQSVFKLLREFGCDLGPDQSCDDRGQGFLDSSGNFHNRSDAYKIAKSSGQPFNDEYILPNDKLDSSCIRHFPLETPLTKFMSKGN
ncbi:hypothetical protein VmeM32_00224 [Vibrio phage vB_VmeM-32]|nr:hypothetical protein VmeM32_00224 [Vibrio phage vB_VmeM-32]